VPVPSKAEQSEATRRALVAAARGLFAEGGFAGTPTEAIVRAARVTRGALYHHFPDKVALFQAVYEDIESEFVERVVEGIAGIDDPVETLRRGVEVFLDVCLDPAVQRVVLIEGPTVLGWERWRELDQAYGLGLVQAALAVAIDAGALRAVPLEPLAHVLMGGLIEAGLLVATAPDPAAARREVGTALDAIIDGLRTK
jgi:AcrR family transcriptional regulator